MLGVGVIEGFFGPEWSWQARHHFCENLNSLGGNFYIYAPKRDSFLRRNWMQNHPPDVWNQLKELSLKCIKNKVSMGIGLSPFEIHANWNLQTKAQLRDKIQSLAELEYRYLGLFFDDMKGSVDLADRQIEIVEYVKSISNKEILFCPTYYSHDPILDKVFGPRQPDYLKNLGQLSKDIQIFWTGSKVIPKSILAEELQQVAQTIKRKPLIWDNYFANDGPKQCKFLKLKPFEGRSESAFKNSSGWALNLMNQPRLSEILFASSARVLKGENPLSAFKDEIEKDPDAELLKNYATAFNEKGLDGIDQELRKTIVTVLRREGPSQEVQEWLSGQYLVGDECLTD